MSSGEDEDAVSVASGGSDADAGSDDAPSVASGDAGSATDGDSDAGSGDMAQERGKTAVEQWADEAGGAAAAAAEAELARQLALLDNPESIRKIATDKTEEKLSHEKARQAAKEVADKALREEEAKKGPPVHRGRPRRKPRALPPPVARAGEILIKRGMLQDMNVEEDQVGTGLVEIVKNAQGKLCIRFDELDIPNPGHHHLAGMSCAPVRCTLHAPHVATLLCGRSDMLVRELPIRTSSTSVLAGEGPYSADRRGAERRGKHTFRAIRIPRSVNVESHPHAAPCWLTPSCVEACCVAATASRSYTYLIQNASRPSTSLSPPSSSPTPAR